jgi:hypothetical protein
MQAPKLTIGMAHFDDFHGLYFSVQSLRLHHPEAMQGAELVVVDNSPHTPHGKGVKSFLGNMGGSELRGVKYIPHEANTGTSVTRDMVFQQATGDVVMVMDCHVIYPAGSLRAMLEYYAANPGTLDIVQGPLVYDNMTHTTTHFNDEWRGEMWGTWGAAWRCKCGKDGLHFSYVNNNNTTESRYLTGGSEVATTCPKCGAAVPVLPWAGHEQKLLEQGYTQLGTDPTDPPFEIPGQGLGTFTMRREAWPGFNPHARGFGGEELYIHGKVRARGGRAMCLPAFRWLHRFARPDGAPYPLTQHNKVRNYVLEFQEMGWDLAPIREHFVNFPAAQWEALVADPVAAGDGQRIIAAGKIPPTGCNSCSNSNQTKLDDIEVAYNTVLSTNRDLNEHMPMLRRLAGMVRHVTEFSGRHDSTVAFLAGAPAKLVSYQTEHNDILARLRGTTAHKVDHIEEPLQSMQVPAIEKTDLLFIDTRHTYDVLTRELETYSDSVRRFIVLHDTHVYGQFGEDGQKGLLAAVSDWLEKNPSWSIIYHTTDQYGLTVLGRQKQDKPKLPGKLKMAANFTKAMADHVTTGANMAEKGLLEARLKTCTLCSQRVDNRCASCGCNLFGKASLQSSECPLGLWPQKAGGPVAVPPMANPVLEGKASG